MPSPLESSTVEPWYIDNPSSKLKFPKKKWKEENRRKKNPAFLTNFDEIFPQV